MLSVFPLYIDLLFLFVSYTLEYTLSFWPSTDIITLDINATEIGDLPHAAPKYNPRSRSHACRGSRLNSRAAPPGIRSTPQPHQAVSLVNHVREHKHGSRRRGKYPDGPRARLQGPCTLRDRSLLLSSHPMARQLLRSSGGPTSSRTYLCLLRVRHLRTTESGTMASARSRLKHLAMASGSSRRAGRTHRGL